MYIITATCETNYGVTIQSKFLGTADDLKNLKALVGREIGFGEYSGKHSEVFGTLEEADIVALPISENDANVILKHIGAHISGENFFSFIDIEEEHGDILEKVYDLCTPEMVKVLDAHIAANKSYVQTIKTYHRMDALGELIPYHLLVEWDALEDDAYWDGNTNETPFSLFDSIRIKSLLDAYLLGK